MAQDFYDYDLLPARKSLMGGVSVFTGRERVIILVSRVPGPSAYRSSEGGSCKYSVWKCWLLYDRLACTVWLGLAAGCRHLPEFPRH